MRDCIVGFYYAHLYGDWESMKRWLWIYGHLSIVLATALLGYSLAKERYLFALVLLPFPVVYLYKRYEKAKTYKVQAETPV